MPTAGGSTARPPTAGSPTAGRTAAGSSASRHVPPVTPTSSARAAPTEGRGRAARRTGGAAPARPPDRDGDRGPQRRARHAARGGEAAQPRQQPDHPPGDDPVDQPADRRRRQRRQRCPTGPVRLGDVVAQLPAEPGQRLGEVGGGGQPGRRHALAQLDPVAAEQHRPHVAQLGAARPHGVGVAVRSAARRGCRHSATWAIVAARRRFARRNRTTVCDRERSRFHAPGGATGASVRRLTDVRKNHGPHRSPGRAHARVVSPSARTRPRTCVVAPTEWTCMEVE